MWFQLCGVPVAQGDSTRVTTCVTSPATARSCPDCTGPLRLGPCGRTPEASCTEDRGPARGIDLWAQGHLRPQSTSLWVIPETIHSSGKSWLALALLSTTATRTPSALPARWFCEVHFTEKEPRGPERFRSHPGSHSKGGAGIWSGGVNGVQAFSAMSGVLSLPPDENHPGSLATCPFWAPPGRASSVLSPVGLGALPPGPGRRGAGRDSA